MAEILLSLTIIGVVAAITLPSLTGNINERTWNTQRKALYSRFSQALSLMPALNGYGKFTEGVDSAGSTVITEDTTAEAFVTQGLSKVLKINNICDSDHLSDCGIPDTIVTLNASKINNFTTTKNTLVALNSNFNSAVAGAGGAYISLGSSINTKTAAFETQNGESIIVYYNRACRGNFDDQRAGSYWAQTKMCVNFIYDLNGKKGPNTVGKDIGVMTAFYPTDPILVAPVSIFKRPAGGSLTTCQSVCRRNNGRLPNIHELMSLGINNILFNMTLLYTGAFWSSTKADADSAYTLHLNSLLVVPINGGASRDETCVKYDRDR